MDFNSKLQRLESDIHLISAIRDILICNDSNVIGSEKNEHRSNVPPDELPVRDTPFFGNLGDNNTNDLGQGTGKFTANANVTCRNPVKARKHEIVVNESMHPENSLVIRNNENRESNKVDGTTDEAKTRLEIEESAKIVMIRLQKVEDDLRREKEVKRSLLEGTLQMKNQLQSYNSQIIEHEKCIANLQMQNNGLTRDINLSDERRVKEAAEYQNKIEVIEFEQAELIKRNSELDNSISVLNMTNAELNSKFHKTQEDLAMQTSILRTELDTSLKRFTQLDEEKRKTEQQLQRTSQKLPILKEKLKSADLKLQNQQQNLSIQLQEKEEQIKSLNSMLKQERVGLSQKIDAATNLVSRTKSCILELQNEKQTLKNQAQTYILDIRQLQQDNALLEQNVEQLKHNATHQENFRERFWSLNQESSKNTRHMEHECEKLKEQLQREQDLVKELMNINRKHEEEKVVIESKDRNLKDELKRVSDNLQILQKVSEDQGKTISKQRNELESNSELRHKLELQLREAQEMEKAAVLHLRDEEKENEDKEIQISHLEHQLTLLNNEVKKHDCEEFVESKLMLKVIELQKKVSSLESEMKSKGEETDKAVAAARKAITQTTQMKKSCEQKICKMKNTTDIEILQIRKNYQKEETDRNKKVSELEFELGKTRESWRQMQNAYNFKIQQLQTALNACVGVGHISSSVGMGQQGFAGSFIPSSCGANFSAGGGFHGFPFL